MAIVEITPADIIGSINTTTGDIDFTDVATGLLTWGSIPIHMLKTPSLLRRAFLNFELQITDDRPGAWSIIKGVRDKILDDIGFTLIEI